MTTDSYITAQYLKVIGAGLLIFVVVFALHDVEVGSKYRLLVPYGANFTVTVSI